jgi:hypothetical protein
MFLQILVRILHPESVIDKKRGREQLSSSSPIARPENEVQNRPLSGPPHGRYSPRSIFVSASAEDRSANGTSAGVGRAASTMRSHRRDRPAWMRRSVRVVRLPRKPRWPTSSTRAGSLWLSMVSQSGSRLPGGTVGGSAGPGSSNSRLRRGDRKRPRGSIAWQSSRNRA